MQYGNNQIEHMKVIEQGIPGCRYVLFLARINAALSTVNTPVYIHCFHLQLSDLVTHYPP